MERWKKISYPLIIILFAIIIGVFIWGRATQEWEIHRGEKEIWLPTNYQLENKANNSYRLLINYDVPPGATLSFEDFKELFDNATVFVDRHGLVWYWTEINGKVFKSSCWLDIDGQHPVDEARMISDKNVRLYYNGFVTLWIYGLVLCIFAALGSIGLGVIIDAALPKRI